MNHIVTINMTIKKNKENEGVVTIIIETDSKDIFKLIVVNIGIIHPFVNIERIEVEEYKATIFPKINNLKDIEEALELLQKKVIIDVQELNEG